MKTQHFLTALLLTSLSGCAQYKLAPVESIVDTPPEVYQDIAVVVEDEPAAPVIEEPTFMDISPSAWTVQIAALRDLEKMDTVETQNRLSDVIRVPTRDEQLGELHTVLVGVYQNREDAQRVAEQLPTKVAGDDPWIRSIASVQAVMR